MQSRKTESARNIHLLPNSDSGSHVVALKERGRQVSSMNLILYFEPTFSSISLLCNVFTRSWRRCFMNLAVFCTLSYSTCFYICHSTIRARAPSMAFMPSFHPNSIKRTDFISRKLQPTWFWGAAKTSQCRLSLGWWDRAPGVLLIGQNILTGLLRLGWQKFAQKHHAERPFMYLWVE